jgi:trimeric autotransporter adhesin
MNNKISAGFILLSLSVLISLACGGSNSSSTSSTSIISTIAGTGTSGYNGDGIAATNAEISLPWGVVSDSNGNIYIADTVNNRIRKVDTSGIISTIAGTGASGYSGDGDNPTVAELDQPYDIVICFNGIANEIYFAEAPNHIIRRIDGMGKIRTFAGTGTGGFSGDTGQADIAQLKMPADVFAVVDNLHKITLYIADMMNNRIRKITPGCVISTIAGTGTEGYSGDGGAATSADLKTPSGVAADSNGNVYIADTGNHRIRKINTGGIISTIAGTGTPGFSGDGGAATSADLKTPEGLEIDSSGNLYFADSGNHRIRKINTGGIISTIAGTGAPGFSGDGGDPLDAQLNKPKDISIDINGYIYIADFNNNRIRRIAP